MTEEYKRLFGDAYCIYRDIKNTAEKQISVYLNKENGKMLKLTGGKFSPEVYKVLMHINQKNLPTIYDVQCDEDITVVLEEYIKGMSVAEVLECGTYNEKGTRRVSAELCDALYALHSHGIIHRDIKPENVIISDDGEVKLIDFDAARIYSGYKSGDTVVMGTVGFAAPEQFGFSQTDGRADIFSLGILINVMLTGEHPSKKLYNGKKIKRIIERCTYIEPDKRYADITELKSDL